MDSSALRWVLAIIGILVIAGVYLFSVYQEKMRRRASINTFTKDELELEKGLIEDENLRRELSSINTMLDNELDNKEIEDISINPGIEAETRKTPVKPKPAQLPPQLIDVDESMLVAHVLKPVDQRLLSGSELLEAFATAHLKRTEDELFCVMEQQQIHFFVADMTETGSFRDIRNDDYSCSGFVCFFNTSDTTTPIDDYEKMLKIIDELVRLLDLKVYSQDLQLLIRRNPWQTTSHRPVDDIAETGPDQLAKTIRTAIAQYRSH
jgi:FtsZ-interacting cell division protein ZipA